MHGTSDDIDDAALVGRAFHVSNMSPDDLLVMQHSARIGNAATMNIPLGRMDSSAPTTRHELDPSPVLYLSIAQGETCQRHRIMKLHVRNTNLLLPRVGNFRVPPKKDFRLKGARGTLRADLIGSGS